MEKLLILDKEPLYPSKGKIIKLKKLKWEKFNQFLYIAKLSSIINVNIPHYEEKHFFKQEAYISRGLDNLYSLSTSIHSENKFVDINPLFSLSEAKTIMQNFCEDWYDIEYGISFKII